jgi:hypothetical protein
LHFKDYILAGADGVDVLVRCFSLTLLQVGGGRVRAVELLLIRAEQFDCFILPALAGPQDRLRERVLGLAANVT